MQKSLLFLIAFIFIVGAGMGVYALSQSPTGPFARNFIKKEIARANYCQTTSDCQVVAVSKCPFGCYVHVNKNEVSRIETLLNKYQSNCEYSCIEYPGVSCVANTCQLNEKPLPEDNEEIVIPNNTITITGTFTCLPHKNTSGPQTMECAFGLKADDGHYYALDIYDYEQKNGSGSFPTEGRLSLSGRFVPLEALSSDVWYKYNMKGIVSVTDFSLP